MLDFERLDASVYGSTRKVFAIVEWIRWPT
jgi:hypothetical protein